VREGAHWGCYYATARVCVFYYCRTYYKAVRVGGECTREEPGTLTQGAPVFPGSSRLGIEPKTPEWLVQDPTTRPIGDLVEIESLQLNLWSLGLVCFIVTFHDVPFQ
jgi:hypothetical protein